MGTLQAPAPQPCSAWGPCLGTLLRDILGDLLRQLCPASGPHSGTLFRDPSWGPAPPAMPCSGTLLGAGLCRGRGTLTPTLSQVRHNLLNVPQYDSVMADLRRDIQHLKGQRDTKPGQGERRDTSDIQGTARTPPALPRPPPPGSTLMPHPSSPGSAARWPPSPPPAGGHRAARPAPTRPHRVCGCKAPLGTGSLGEPGWG